MTSKPKLTTRRPRRKPMNVNAVLEAAEFRLYMRNLAAEREAFRRRNAFHRRAAAKLTLLAIVGGFTFVVVAHAMAISN